MQVDTAVSGSANALYAGGCEEEKFNRYLRFVGFRFPFLVFPRSFSSGPFFCANRPLELGYRVVAVDPESAAKRPILCT
jgi:hypothetical protein